MTVEVTVDRIEGAVAVLEVGGQFVDWPLGALPEGIQEGSRVSVHLTVLDSASAEAEARLDRLRARSGSGDIEL